MNKRRGLGRGLGALFPGGAAQTASVREPASRDTVVHIPVGDIEPNPGQPRRHLDELELEGLGESIRANGLLAPILVRPLRGRQAAYQIIAGERRWRATQLAGLRTIPAVVRDVADGQSIELALIENVQRTDLNPIEEASGYRQLLEEHGFTQETLSQRLGKARPTITNALRLLSLPDAVQALIRDAKISAGHGRAVAALPAAQAVQIARRAAADDLSVRDVERLAARAMSNRRAYVRSGRRPELPPNLADVESKLRFALAARVRLTHGPAGGTIEIGYADDEELQRIVERICPPQP